MALEIGTGSKVISVDCGIHAREWVSPAYCQWFIHEAIDGRFAQYTSDVKFLVQPVLNPDGYEYTWSSERMWRKNRSTQNGVVCIGADLNRNYDANWSGPGASAQPCSESYHGPALFSEPESRAQRDYMAPYMTNGSLKVCAAACRLKVALVICGFSFIVKIETRCAVGIGKKGSANNIMFRNGLESGSR